MYRQIMNWICMKGNLIVGLDFNPFQNIPCRNIYKLVTYLAWYGIVFV
jgi:hypothetical protein